MMGVTGAGKTTIGRLLAERLGWEFADADDFHSPENITKMSQGLPLEDADRLPWLRSLRTAMDRWTAEKRNVVLACSALKKSYRELLAAGPQVRFIYLKGSYGLIWERLRHRHGHFANEQLLASQFSSLEEPDDALVVNIDGSAEQVAAEIDRRLRLDDNQPGR